MGREGGESGGCCSCGSGGGYRCSTWAAAAAVYVLGRSSTWAGREANRGAAAAVGQAVGRVPHYGHRRGWTCPLSPIGAHIDGDGLSSDAAPGRSYVIS